MTTPDQITITSDLVYEGCGLTIGYCIKGSAAVRMLSDDDLMRGLKATGQIDCFYRTLRQVIDHKDFCLSLDDFMRMRLREDMAQKLIAHYLNHPTDKSGNYKTYTI